ncbi:MAG: spinster family MFS transporter [Gammaproteobacteria bacterium]
MSESSAPPQVGGRYSWYVLCVLVLVYVFNFIDRQILSILNEDIKADLGLTDAHMGFLYGTAFAVFYAVFGIPLGRLADMWVRRKMIALGLFFWSLMTALSGTARGFGSLAAFRIGVGVGESSASPAAISMLGDYFPPRLRATAVAVYSSGIYVGAGIGMLIGGQIVDRWNRTYEHAAAPFGLVGWQAAFFAVGLPGLALALWVWTLREPVRGQSEGLPAPPPHPAPFRELMHELGAVIPPLTVISLWRLGGAGQVALNLVTAGVCAGSGYLLTDLLGSPAQWAALGIGVYAFFSWVQSLRLRDYAAFRMIYCCPALVFGMLGFSWCAFVGYGAGYWAAPYFIRVHGESASTVGTVLGLTSMTAGWLGVTLGGVFSDWFRARNANARLYCGMLTALVSTPCALVVFTTGSVELAYAMNFAFTFASSAWIGSAVALVNELVVPRMRATVSASWILTATFIGLALGPYSIGQLSTSLSADGMAAGEALRAAVLWGVGGYLLVLVFLLVARRTLVRDESSRVERARAVGEPV